MIDAASGTDHETIRVEGGIHNVYVTPDGKFAVAGSIPARLLDVIDTATNTLAWTSKLSGPGSARWRLLRTPMDQRSRSSSTFRLSRHRSGRLRLAQRSETDSSARTTWTGEGDARHPGIAVAWPCDHSHGKLLGDEKWYGYVAAYSLPDFKLMKLVPVGSHPEWLTIPPDGKNLYVACAGRRRHRCCR